MSMSVQEQKSSFTSSTTKSVQVVQNQNNSSSGVGEIYVPACDISSIKSGNDISSSTSASSINSDSTLRGDVVFRPTITNFDSLFGVGQEFEDVSKDVYSVNDGQTFEMKLDVQVYKPEEIQVKISDNLVTVSAKQEQRTENNFRSCQFSKKFSIPHGVKPESIQCNLTAQGVLKISAPIEKSSGAITNKGGEEQITSANTTSTSSKTQQQQAQHKQVTKTQQESTTSSRKSSINSDISSIRDMSSFDDEFVLRPRRIDFDSLISQARQDSLDFHHQDISKQVSNSSDGKKFEMKLEIQNFKPEEVEVKITKNLIKIEGKHESEFASRSFYKEFTIPHGVQKNTIQCSMNDQGVLTISAPIQQTQQAINSSVNKTATATRTEQEVTSNSVRQQQQNTIQKQQQQVHSDSTSSINSINSNVSNVSSRRVDDFILRPIMDFDSLLGQQTSFEDISKEICQINDGKKFETKLQVPDFKPEELQVKISNNMVTIEGKQETSTSSRSFYKKFSIPQGVTPEQITSSLSPSGILTISAPINNQNQQTIGNGNNVNATKTVQQQQTTTTKTTSTNVGNAAVRNIQNTQNQSQNQQQIHSSDINTSVISNFGQDFILRPIPSMDLDYLTSRDSRFEDISKEICQKNDTKKFETKLDVPDFKPEELEVKISESMVTITGKTEMREENNFSSRSFYKKFSIPQGVKPENITSSLSPKGVLTISAPIEIQQNQSQTQEAITRQVNANISQQSSYQQQLQEQQKQNEQQHQQIQQHQQQVQKQHQRLEQTVTSDNTSSLNSNSSISKRVSDQDFILRPIMHLNNLMSLDSSFEDVSKEIAHANDGKKFEMKFDVPDFKPEELEVKISNNLVSIQGKTEMRQENNFSSRSFCKKFSIPHGVKPENITSSLSPKGVLTISAPIEIQNQSQSQICSSTSNTTSRQEQNVQQNVQQQQQQVQQQRQVSSTTSVSQNVSQNVSSNLASSILNNKVANAKEIAILRPQMNFDNLTSIQSSNFEDISKELCHVTDGKNFEMKLEVQEFKPEEIQVKISNNLVTIEGKQEMNEENSFRSRQFCKKFSIPQGVKPENLVCSFADGILNISAPMEKCANPALALTERTSSVESKQVQEQSGTTTKKVSSTFSSTQSSTVQSGSTQF